MSDLSHEQLAQVKRLFHEIDETDATIANQVAHREGVIAKLHAVAGARPYIHKGRTLTPVVRAKKGSTTETEAFLRGANVSTPVSLD